MSRPLRDPIIMNPSPPSFEPELRHALESFAELLSTLGYRVAAHTPEALARFASYPHEIQERIYGGFARYVSAVMEITDAGVPLESVSQSLWCLFKRRDLRPQPDLFSRILEGDIVEIYLPNQVQWYRSFNYFRYTSYSLGELICFPWNELIEHENSHMQEFIRITEGMFAGEINRSVTPELGHTLSRERFSSRRLMARLEPRIISPIADAQGRNQAFAIAWSIQLVDELERGPGTEPFLTSLQPLTAGGDAHGTA